VTEIGEDYRKIQFNIRLPTKFIEEFKVFVSRKWPVYNHGILSSEVQLAMKMWMENEGRTAHTQKYSSC
jgi:hypothetical protein